MDTEIMTHKLEVGAFIATSVDGVRLILRIDVNDAWLGPQPFYGVRPIAGPDDRMILADAALVEAAEEVDVADVPFEHRVQIKPYRVADARGRTFATFTSARDANRRSAAVSEFNAEFERGTVSLLDGFAALDALPGELKSTDLFSGEELKRSAATRATNAHETQVSGLASGYNVWIDVWRKGEMLGEAQMTWREACQLIERHKSLASNRLDAKFMKMVETHKANGWSKS